MQGGFQVSARDIKSNKILGTATLVKHIQPLGNFLNLQDVVVDSNIRGVGVESKLVEGLFKIAKKNGYKTIELTASRLDAQKFWNKNGFEKYVTQVFKKKL